jgi:cyanophycinase
MSVPATAIALALAWSATVGPTPQAAAYVRVGAATDAVGPMRGGVVLMGGGDDVDDAFRWMCERAPGGDFLVVRAAGTDEYNSYVRELCPGLNSVATLVIPTAAAARDPDVRSTIRQAEVIWIAGGDQALYIDEWQGTPVQQAINERVAAGAPIGGTSAGLAVLTQFVYSARAPGCRPLDECATSPPALADPFYNFVTIDRDFVNLGVLAGTIGDTHFRERDRMGRALAFLCRIQAAGWSNRPRGIFVDEQAALLVDGHDGTVVGKGHVYLAEAPGAPEVCREKTPLTYRDIAIYRIDATGAFNLSNWIGHDGVAYSVSAVEGVLSSTQPGGSPY